MGFTMQFDLNYQHYRSGLSFLTSETVVCFIRIRVIPNWRLKMWTDAWPLPSMVGMADGLRLGHAKHYSTGVLVDIYTGGEFRSFDFTKALKFLVSCTVLLQLPGLLVRFIALFGMGSTSQMYRRARRIRLNIYHDFHGAIARILAYQMTYYTLSGSSPQPADADDEQSDSTATPRLLTVHTIEERLRIMFNPFIRSGDMELADFLNMVQLLYRHLDADRDGTITCPEFVNSCLMQDNIQVQDALSDLRWEFIFDDRRKLRLARLLTGRHAWHEGAAAVIACLSTNLGKVQGTVLTEGHS